MQLLPNGKQQFVDQNGAPLAGGMVYFYAPGTNNFVNTYQDAAGTIPNQNPVLLDSNGQAVIWGAGTFRQVVQNASGLTVWDQVVRSAGVPDDSSVTPSKLNLIVQNGTATDTQNIQMVRVANYSGGTYGYVNSALRVRTDVSSGANAFESAAAHILNNGSTSKTSENFAELAQANKTASNSGGTWGRVTEVHEQVATNNPSTPTIGHEIDVYANGTDNLLQRVALGIFTKAQTPGGVACQTGYGINLASVASDTHPGNFGIGIGFGRYGSQTQFNYGIDFTYATFPTGGVPINMVGGQFIAFSPSRNLGYNNGALQYVAGSGTVLQILDNGNVQNANNSYGGISDRRLKSNIKTVEDARTPMRKLRVTEYDIEGRHQFGLIAQEVKRVFPHLIEKIRRGKKSFMALNYMGLLPWTIRYAQQIDEEVQELKHQVAELRAALAERGN